MPELKYKPIAFYPDLIKDWDNDHNNGIDSYSLPPFFTVKVLRLFGDAITVGMNGSFPSLKEQAGINALNVINKM